MDKNVLIEALDKFVKCNSDFVQHKVGKQDKYEDLKNVIKIGKQL